MTPKHHLVIIGFDEIVANKYMACVRQAMRDGAIEGYSVVDLESERGAVEARLRVADPPPHETVFLPDSGTGMRAMEMTAAVLRRHRGDGRSVKVYIATEVRSHEPYLRYCVEHGFDSLVEKPVLAPVTNDRFEPTHITESMEGLIALARGTSASHSVMTLSRYHRIYNGSLINPLRERMLSWKAPLTSLHLRAAGGVWNLQREYEERDDHPYKYGYGMLMHGAYHYVDLATQLLSLNRFVFPGRNFRMELSSFGAFPVDQHLRIPHRHAGAFHDEQPRWARHSQAGRGFGETDITSVFRLVDSEAGSVLTLGTLSFEQTTPSIRNWERFPEGRYNKNGRTSSVSVEAQLSTLCSTHVHCYDVPRGTDADRIDAFARITTRANASLLPDEAYVSVEEFGGLFHSDSNRLLMEHWLRGTERRSTLPDHLLAMKVTEALASSLAAQGNTISTEF